MIQTLIIFIVGLAFLIAFSIIDVVKREIDNFWILIMALLGVTLVLSIQQFIPALFGAAIFFIVGFLLWTFETIGAADAKILAVLPCYFAAIGFPNLFVKMWFFLIIMLIVGIVYAATFKIATRKQNSKTKKKHIPFIPAITITYILLWLMNIR